MHYDEDYDDFTPGLNDMRWWQWLILMMLLPLLFVLCYTVIGFRNVADAWRDRKGVRENR